MMELIAARVGDRWVPLQGHLGARVDDVRVSDERALVLRFSGSQQPWRLRIPAPWQFTSCLQSVSSGEFGEKSGASSGLVGLEGAQLSAIEADERHLDLVLGSIRISVTHWHAEADR